MTTHISHAMLLAAGLGTRMRPITNTIPKPLVPVHGRTLIDRVLDWMQQGDIENVVVNSHYLSDMLHAHLAQRKHPHITISHEDTLLETGGGIANALPKLGDAPFLSANSDTLCIDGPRSAIKELADHWRDDVMDALLLLQPTQHAIGYDGVGDFFLNEDNSLRRRGDAVSAPYVFTGVQLLHPRLFADAKPEPFSMNVLYDRFKTEDASMPRTHGLVHTGNWLHVGDPGGLIKAENWINENSQEIA